MISIVKKFVLTGLMISLVFVLTYIIKVPVPYTSGYIHLGDSMIYLSVIILGPFYGAFASGMGSMLSDLLGGYAQFAVPTFIIKSIMALCMGLILSGKTKKTQIFSIISSLVVWIAFSAGAIFHLQHRISSDGTGKILDVIVEPGADAEAISKSEKLLSSLPLYIVLGIAASVVILVIAAYLISKKTGGGIFNIQAIIGMTASGMCMVMGYFIAESFMYGPIPATFSIPMNLVQFFGGVLVAGFLIPQIKRATSVLNL